MARYTVDVGEDLTGGGLGALVVRAHPDGGVASPPSHLLDDELLVALIAGYGEPLADHGQAFLTSVGEEVVDLRRRVRERGVSPGDAAFAARLNALFAALAPLGDELRSEIVLDLARYLTPILPHPREEGR